MPGMPLSHLFFREGAIMKNSEFGVRDSKIKERNQKKGHKKQMRLNELVILIKGAGEMASGIAQRLYMAGIKKIVMTEIVKPLCVRRAVSFCEAVFEGKMSVEDVNAELVERFEEARAVWGRHNIAVIIDPEWSSINILKPHVVVDAIMAKRNLGTNKNEAPLVIGVGPGFNAPNDVHVVVESNRGHNLGRTIYKGGAEPYTGIPGQMMSYAKERVLRSPVAGTVKHIRALGDTVKEGDLILEIDSTPVLASIDGVLRGLIREIPVTEGEKIGDVDPRAKVEYCNTISEKARAIGGGVLEAIMHVYNKP